MIRPPIKTAPCLTKSIAIPPFPVIRPALGFIHHCTFRNTGLALAHVRQDKVEAAYFRGDLFEKRQAMMSDWAVFVTSAGFPASPTHPGHRPSHRHER
ncbi:hypothetical protein C3F00_028825 [Pseudomonas sp. MWU13-2860]|nr:hypothetical protein C3F00_028825 [Pseudomonas sp. MWU13-2860]